MKKFHWGIVGLGSIAQEFAESFNQQSSELVAVASRTLEKAQTFATRHAIKKAYGDYQDMLQDPEVDIVYIAVPNRQHIDYILPALEAGKHVLCEKAITMNKAELQKAIQLAEQKNLILAEAMTIFNMPLYQQLRSMIDSGKLGALKMIQAPFGSYKEPDPTNRFFNPDLAGGALLDIGTYAVSFARFFLSSQPEVIASRMIPFKTGVDEQSVTILQNKENELATISLTFQAKMPKVGIVAFENGYLSINDYPRADQAEIIYTDGTKELIESGNRAQAMNYEIENMVKMIEGELPNRSLYLTTEVIALLDEMQEQWKKNG
ncbi:MULTISPECIES: Gfo/Idh/MocA family protein [unclassified Enterococcus]|uniref:Gfo/Idh/MocA family protein n=1 Tax=unclassified Enterococcus TaxID=2608891 RepID=UPI001A9A96B1|nr:Gfo/Idh/MocA family oxidoreductase [Enterococcus sp. DIV1271a]MBO1298786.1 Gfo/Idh/MocA family oxidoreductase [Enterococcus sp. DIV1271a]